MANMPPYVRSSNPEVIAAHEANENAWKDFHDACSEYAKECGSDQYYTARGFATVFLTGLPEKPEGRGRWTSTSPYRPYRNNPEYAHYAALKWVCKTLPGLPNTVSKPAIGTYSTLIGIPSMGAFQADGYVYATTNGATTITDGSFDMNVWEEIKGSQHLAAKEIYNKGIGV